MAMMRHSGQIQPGALVRPDRHLVERRRGHLHRAHAGRDLALDQPVLQQIDQHRGYGGKGQRTAHGLLPLNITMPVDAAMSSDCNSS